MLSFEISPQEVQRKLQEGAAVELIDVREPHENQLARIENSALIPMRSVPAALPRLGEAADSKTLIVYCHHGVRSLQVVNWLREQGIESCQSLAGGIDRWSLEIDRTIPRY